MCHGMARVGRSLIVTQLEVSSKSKQGLLLAAAVLGCVLLELETSVFFVPCAVWMCSSGGIS